jgi:signal transduction histidine kinase
MNESAGLKTELSPKRLVGDFRVDSVATMQPLLKVLRQWGAPAAAVIFFVLWFVGEVGRDGSLQLGPMWSGIVSLVVISTAIAVSVLKPYLSLGLSAAVLVGQLLYFIPSFRSNTWPIYLGAFISLAFILWTASKRRRLVAAGANLVFVVLMTYLMISWRYGSGVGWFEQLYHGDRVNFLVHGGQLFSILFLIAAAFGSVGLLLALYEERGNLFRARNQAQSTLKETEVHLIVEQERTRIARDLHDVLAHSLAVIAAQADGTRYLSKDQPKAVLNALENIAVSARSALVDAQRVIEGVHDDGMVTPQPRLSDVGPLVDRMKKQGSLAIEQSQSGDPLELTAGQQMAVFRIVQECLTNALKHGGRGTAVRLHFDWSGPGLAVNVASALPGENARTAAEGDQERVGRGLPGMRERAHLAGGWITAGPDGEQFRVTFFIPYGKRPSDSLQQVDTSEAKAVLEANLVLETTGYHEPAVRAFTGSSSSALSLKSGTSGD